MKADFSQPFPSKPKEKVGTVWIILASLILHLVILVLVARTPNEIPNFEASSEPKPEIKPITARLIYTQAALPADVSKEETPEPEPVVEPEPEPITEPEPVVEPEPEPIVEPEPKTPPVQESDSSFIQNDPLASPADEKRPERADNEEQTVADKVKDQLHDSSQRSIAELAAEEAARYRREQTSPSLLDKPELSDLTEDEKLEKANEVLADCSSYTNKGIAILASLTGGNIKCTTTNGAESFIQDRLKKSAHLPAMEDKKDD